MVRCGTWIQSKQTPQYRNSSANIGKTNGEQIRAAEVGSAVHSFGHMQPGTHLQVHVRSQP